MLFRSIKKKLLVGGPFLFGAKYIWHRPIWRWLYLAPPNLTTLFRQVLCRYLYKVHIYNNLQQNSLSNFLLFLVLFILVISLGLG